MYLVSALFISGRSIIPDERGEGVAYYGRICNNGGTVGKNT